MRRLFGIAAGLAICLCAGAAWAGMYEDFTIICRDTDAASAASAAAARRLGFGPSTDPEAKDLAREMPGALILERKRGKENIQLIIGPKRDPKLPGYISDSCMMLGRGVPGSEARKVRAWLGAPTGSFLGQAMYVYRLTPSGPVVLKAKTRGDPAHLKAGEMRSISAGGFMGLATQISFARIRPE